MSKELFSYEQKLLKEVSKEKFSFKMLLKLVKLCELSEQLR